MSNYYDYREVKVMIAHKLMTMEGWKVYGYKEDESDGMTDYYSPANWDGVAEKNGYILCVNVYGAEKEQEIKKYNKKGCVSSDIASKIKKLEAVTMGRGASQQEEETAKKKIALLLSKNEEVKNDYEVVGVIPAHMENPSRCNWHIEKDGVIVAKGNGILKYKDAYNYFNYDSYKKDYDEFRKDSKKWVEKWCNDVVMHGYYDSVESAMKVCESRIKDMNDTLKVIDAFNKWINKIDVTCGGMLGDGEIEQYEKVTVTEYKKENKVVECDGEIKEGQCFVLKTNFNHNCYSGLVYRIHETEYNGKKYYHAYKLNGKLTKECTGLAISNNSWSTFDEKFMEWIKKGYISFCEIKEVKTPYEVEKMVKKTIRKNQSEKQEKTKEEVKQDQQVTIENYNISVGEDVDTRDNSKIYVIKCNDTLSREEYIKLNKIIKKLGGYYSKFKHGFIFKELPSELLSNNNKQYDTNENKSNNDDIQQDDLQEVIIINHNKDMKTIEVSTENAKIETIKQLKDHGFIYLSGLKKYIADYNANTMQWLDENFNNESTMAS